MNNKSTIKHAFTFTPLEVGRLGRPSRLRRAVLMGLSHFHTRKGFTPHHFSTKNGAGFTLIEMMVVVVIIAITIGGAVFFAAGSYRKTSVRNAARDVASLMRLASSKALSERVYYNVVLSSEDCHLEKHYSGTTDGSIWEDIPASTSVDETDDNYFVIDNSPGAKKKLANVVDIDDGTGTTLGLRKIAFTTKETVMGITADDVMTNATWTQSDTYSVFLDDDDSGTGNVQYRVTVDSDTARVKIYSSW